MTATDSLDHLKGVGAYLANRRTREAELRRAPPSRLEARIKRFTVAGVVVLAVLNAADYVTTKMLLQHVPAGAREANPLAGLLLDGRHLLVIKLVIVALLGIAVLRDRPRLGMLIGVSIVTGFYMTAVVSNILILRMY